MADGLDQQALLRFAGNDDRAMLAAEMSTDSGYLLTWATVIYNDLMRISWIERLIPWRN